MITVAWSGGVRCRVAVCVNATLDASKKVEEAGLNVEKIKGEENPADLMAKHLAAPKIKDHMSRVNQEFHPGLADMSLKM